MSLINQFKKFALRGNVIDMAIGFTVGAAFSTIAKSLVNDVIMPPVGLLLGRADFSDLFWVLKEGESAPVPYPTLAAAQQAGAVTINYGEFVNNIVAFLIVAIVMFAIVRAVNAVDDKLEAEFSHPKAPDEPPEKKCPWCLSSIPYRARRCPDCTSELELPDEQKKRVAENRPPSRPDGEPRTP